jgi:hypothetical protein
LVTALATAGSITTVMEIKILRDGIEFHATYEVLDDTLVVLLPDGSRRMTELQGLKPEHAALTHLKAYAHAKLRT